MSSSLVSVIIPAYNRAHSVGKAVESVLRQTYRPIEVIVVDDGSIDSTAEVLKTFGNRIRVLRQDNAGPSSARNKGVAHSVGHFIAFLDSDDTWMPEKLDRQIRLLIAAGPRVPCCVCNSETIAGGIKGRNSFDLAGVKSGLSEGYWLNPAELIATRFLLFNQVVLIRREAFEKIGGFKEDMRILEDHDLAFRLALLGPWAFISEELVVKFDEADGLGVQARNDPTKHSEAWKKVLEGFLHEEIEQKDMLLLHIRRGLSDVALEIDAHSMHGVGIRGRTMSRLLLLWLRAKGAIRRRLKSWPRVKAVKSLTE